MTLGVFIQRFVKYAVIVIGALILLEVQLDKTVITVQDMWVFLWRGAILVGVALSLWNVVRFIFTARNVDDTTGEYVAEALMSRDSDGNIKPVTLTADEVEHIMTTYTQQYEHREAA